MLTNNTRTPRHSQRNPAAFMWRVDSVWHSFLPLLLPAPLLLMLLLLLLLLLLRGECQIGTGGNHTLSTIDLSYSIEINDKGSKVGGG